jgi:hypothetical protein
MLWIPSANLLLHLRFVLSQSFNFRWHLNTGLLREYRTLVVLAVRFGRQGPNSGIPLLKNFDFPTWRGSAEFVESGTDDGRRHPASRGP